MIVIADGAWVLLVAACRGWLLLAALAVCAWCSWSASAGPDSGRLGLWRLHRDQGAAFRALSFVLTLPFFIMVMLLIVQVSQLMIGTVVVHYAAFAAARSAIVWVPARLGPSGPEWENCISWCYVDPEAPDQVLPILDPTDPDYGPTDGGVTFVVVPGSPKYQKIAAAAVMACMPICPSRDLGLGLPGDGPAAARNHQVALPLDGPRLGDKPGSRCAWKTSWPTPPGRPRSRSASSTRTRPELPLVPYPHLDDEECDLTIEYHVQRAWLAGPDHGQR